MGFLKKENQDVLLVLKTGNRGSPGLWFGNYYNWLELRSGHSLSVPSLIFFIVYTVFIPGPFYQYMLPAWSHEGCGFAAWCLGIQIRNLHIIHSPSLSLDLCFPFTTRVVFTLLTFQESVTSSQSPVSSHLLGRLLLQALYVLCCGHIHEKWEARTDRRGRKKESFCPEGINRFFWSNMGQGYSTGLDTVWVCPQEFMCWSLGLQCGNFLDVGSTGK